MRLWVVTLTRDQYRAQEWRKVAGGWSATSHRVEDADRSRLSDRLTGMGLARIVDGPDWAPARKAFPLALALYKAG